MPPAVDPVTDRLRAQARAPEFGMPALRQAIGEVLAAHPADPAHLREKLVALSAKAWRAWAALADELDRSLGNTVANLIACAGRQDLSVYAVILGLVSDDAIPLEAQGVAAPLRRLLSTEPRTAALVAWLNGGKRPPLEDLILLAIWAGSHDAVQVQATAPSESGCISRRTLLTLTQTFGRRYSPRQATALVGTLASRLALRSDPLTPKQIGALPTAWLNAIIDSPIARKRLLPAALCRKAERHPDRVPATHVARSARQIQNGALAWITNGATGDPTLFRYVASSPQWLKEFVATVSDADSLGLCAPPGASDLIEALQQEWPLSERATSLNLAAARVSRLKASPGRTAVLVLLRPESRRLAAVRRLSIDDVRLLGQAPAVVILVLRGLPSASARLRIIAALSPESRLEVLSRLWQSTADSDIPLADEIFRTLGSEDRDALVSGRGRQYTRSPGQLPLPRSLKIAHLMEAPEAFLQAQLQQRKLIDLFIPSVLEALHARGKRCDELMAIVLRRALNLAYRRQRPRVLERFLKVHPKAVLRVLQSGIKPSDARVLAGFPGLGALSSQVRRSLLLLCAQTREKKSFLRLSLPDLAPQAIEAIENDPVLLARFGPEYPDRFGRALGRSVPLRRILDRLIEAPGLAPPATLYLSDADLPSQLPWLRRRLRDRPRLRAAWELALAFGLEHAPYLLRLVKRLPRTPGQRLSGRSFDELYRVHDLPKKSGGKRLITAPCPPLKRLQRSILDRGVSALPVHEAAAGFRPGSSIRDNAARHVGRSVVVNADIRSCFPSTGHSQILKACQHLSGGRLSPLARAFAAEICSYDGALPTGAPTSPALLNLILRSTDRAIATVASRKGVMYSRYADDLTLSGGNDAVALLPFVRDALATVGYEIEGKKTNIFRRGRRQIVTGLVVNVKPNWPKTLRRRLRAAVHRRIQGGQATWHGRPISDGELKGYLAFLNQTQPQEAGRLLAQLREVKP